MRLFEIKNKRLKFKIYNFFNNDLTKQGILFIIVLLTLSQTVRFIELSLDPVPEPENILNQIESTPTSSANNIVTTDSIPLSIDNSAIYNNESYTTLYNDVETIKKILVKVNSPDKGTHFFESFLDGLYWAVVTAATVGYGDKYPKTDLGKIITFLVIIFGALSMGVITGNVASALVNRKLQDQMGLGRLKKMENHFIICGWKNEMHNVLNSILEANPEINVNEILLVNQAKPETVNQLQNDIRFKGIKYIQGDYIEESVLIKAELIHASTVLVLADESEHTSPQEVDARTVMTVFQIERISKTVYVCAELLDSKFAKTLESSRCDEIILSRDYNRIILANASSRTGISHVITSLLDTDSPTGLVVKSFPSEYVNKTVGELFGYFQKLDGSLLIGLLENTGNFFIRKKEALREAQKTPDIGKIVENLKTVKEMKSNHPILSPSHDYLVSKNSKAIIITKRIKREETSNG